MPRGRDEVRPMDEIENPSMEQLLGVPTIDGQMTTLFTQRDIQYE